MPRRRRSMCWTAGLALVVALLTAMADAQENATPAGDSPTFDAASLEFFESQVRPLLVRRCFECHSDQVDEPKGGLRLDSRAAVLAGGDTGPAVEPGKPDESLLVDAVNYGDIYQMPPKTKLPDDEIAVLTRWVSMGAPWPAESSAGTMLAKSDFDLQSRRKEHWAWQPIQRPVPPACRQADWPSDDLDYFILSRLEQAGLGPSAEADRAVLIRRVYLDLLGVPPSAVEVQQFVADPSPDAYERLVDRLLDSPHFGERWARHWMDLVRYAETFGHEFDYPIRHAWRYRDYLIRAFNADVPYDQLILEHLAGDLLEQPRRHPVEDYNESIIGTGFWFLGEATHAPVDVRGDEAVRVDNQIDVMTKTFLGLTVACARCHDHKFDAISTDDYYALAGFLQSSRRQEAMLDPHHRIAELAAQIRETKLLADRQLAQSLPSEINRDEQDRIARYLLAAQEVQDKAAPAAGSSQPSRDDVLESVARQRQLDHHQIDRWQQALASAESDASHPLYAWRQLHSQAQPWNAATLTKLAESNAEQAAALEQDYPLFADFEGPDFDGWFVTGESFGSAPVAGVSLDVTGDSPRLLEPGVAHGGRWHGRTRGTLRSPTFTITHPNIYYRLAGRGAEIRLIVDGYVMIEFHQLLFGELKFGVDSPDRFVWHRQAGDLKKYLGHRAFIEVIDHGDGWAAIDEIRFSDRDTPPPAVGDIDELLRAAPSDAAQLARAYAERWTSMIHRVRDGKGRGDDVRLVNWWIERGLIELTGPSEPLVELRSQIEELGEQLPAPVFVYAMADGTAENEHVFVRGNHRALGPEVPRRMLTALDGQSPAHLHGSGRLELARQMFAADNPLTARVMVNRIWHHLMGRGLVASVDNFGVLGERPSHPELLDFLAVRFVDEGWSIKRTIRHIVLSSTYRMSSTPRSDAQQVDPQNLLWHRMSIRRLQGEAIRDAMLAVSGQWNRNLFGDSVPVHITSFMQGRGRPGNSGPVDGQGRRSLYIEVRRNFLSPMMLAFDTPIPFNSIGRRNVSNVPAQALILMNDPFVIEQAQQWADRLLREYPDSVDDRLDRMYLAAFGRLPDETERNRAAEFLKTQSEALQLDPEKGRNDRRIWRDLCHVMFNVKEFIYVR